MCLNLTREYLKKISGISRKNKKTTPYNYDTIKTTITINNYCIAVCRHVESLQRLPADGDNEWNF